MANKIDIIIPAYNVPDNILYRCLSSIATQDILEDLEVTIVDDASTTQNYKKVAKYFEPMLKINILRYETNGGPGVARQYGIDNTSNPYLVFIDADDTFNGSFALRTMRAKLEKDPTYYVAIGIFDEVFKTEDMDGPGYIEHKNDLVWMFGKIYKRSFIHKYNIRFHPTSRANEDTGFNTLVRLYQNDTEQITFFGNHVYNWHENKNSITRIHDRAYSYISDTWGSFYGYIENMIYAIKTAEKRIGESKKIRDWKIFCMVNLYQMYLTCYRESMEHAEKNLEHCKLYYKEIYKNIEESVSDNWIKKVYSDLFLDSYMREELFNIIPHVTFYEFLDKLKD